VEDHERPCPASSESLEIRITRYFGSFAAAAEAAKDLAAEFGRPFDTMWSEGLWTVTGMREVVVPYQPVPRVDSEDTEVCAGRDTYGTDPTYEQVLDSAQRNLDNGWPY